MRYFNNVLTIKGFYSTQKKTKKVGLLWVC